MDLQHLRRIGLPTVGEGHETTETCERRPEIFNRRVLAVMPTHSEFDEEAVAAAAAGLPVARFTLTNEVTLAGLPEKGPGDPFVGIFRGFMLSKQRRQFLHDKLRGLGVEPAEYAAAHLFPATFAALRPLSPRAEWVSVDPKRVQPANFAEVVQSVSGWGCPYVLLKDFVKSAKAHGQRFMKVPVDGDLSELACDFVAARGSQFNEGVVFKEYVDLVRYPARGEPTTNEWRLWFMQGLLVEASPNSFQGDAAVPPPEALLAEVAKMAKCIPNPYITIDVAEAETGWIVLEAGDGGVSGPAPGQDLRHHWQLLAAHFGKADGPSA